MLCSGCPHIQQSLYLRYLCLPLQLSLLLRPRPPRLNRGQGQNSPLPLTSPVNKAPVEPFSILVRCICTWPQSSSAVTRKRFSELLSFLRMDEPQSGPRTSFTRRQTLVFFLFSLGLTLNNNSKVSSFQSMQSRMLSTPWKGPHIIKEIGRWTTT